MNLAVLSDVLNEQPGWPTGLSTSQWSKGSEEGHKKLATSYFVFLDMYTPEKLNMSPKKGPFQ